MSTATTPVTKSQWIGNVKQRLNLLGTLVDVKPVEGYYGTSYLCIFNVGGDIVKWFASSNPFGNGSTGWQWKRDDSGVWTNGTEAPIGATMNFRATVKSHDEWRGMRETKVTRAAIDYDSIIDPA